MNVAEIDPLQQSLLGDTLRRIARLQKRDDDESRDQIERLEAVVEARTESLDLWDQATNTTVQAIMNEEIDPNTIKPHVRFEATTYDEKYDDQSEHYEEVAAQADRPLRTGRILTANVNHMFRRQQAIGQIELAFALAARRFPGATINWLDIGCGDGSITNSVDPTRFANCSYEVRGCDFQSGKIALATKQRAINRTFRTMDAFDATAEAAERGEFFHIISAFEFLEHLDDPLAFLTTLSGFDNCLVVVGSPNAQLIDRPFHARPDPVHLWSFTRASFEKLFELAGLTTIATNELNVGSYIGGLDWLSLIAGPREEMRDKRLKWSD